MNQLDLPPGLSVSCRAERAIRTRSTPLSVTSSRLADGPGVASAPRHVSLLPRLTVRESRGARATSGPWAIPARSWSP